MTTFEFLSYLRRLDVKVWAEGDKLRYQALESALLPSLKAELAKRKSDILQVLGELKTNAQPASLSILPIAEGDQSPLSFSQQRLWFLNQVEPDSSFYTELAPVRIKGRLDVPVLERALSEIIRRHEAVRTIFPTIDGHPMQVIQPAHCLKLHIDDLSLLPQAERELEVRQLIKAEAQRSFDLAQGPLMRVRLLGLSPNEYVMVVTMHHIITDGWSMGVLVHEVGALYQAFASGNPSPLSELPIQYADYARWQRQWMSGEVLESQLRYWRKQLGGELPVLDLPTDRPRPAKQSFNGARHTVALGLELSRNLEVMSREQGVTLFMTLLATLQILLHRYTSQTDVRVGTQVANRTRAESEKLIGLFVNTLVLRADLSGNPSFCELLGRVRETALEAYAHQELPFEKLVEELNPERDLSHTPLFQVMFVLQNAPMPALELSGLELTQIEIEPGTAKFDLVFALVETAEGLRGWFEYNTALFDEASIDRMCGHYRRLLVEAVAKPEERLSKLPLLTEAEREQIVVTWNQTARSYPEGRCVHELFAEQAARVPERMALVCEEQQVSYGELDRRANHLARYLRSQGVGPEALVGLCLERSVEMVVGLLGVLKAGAAYVPMDAAYPDERLRMMIEDAQLRLLLTQELLARRFEGQPVNLICLDRDQGIISASSAEKQRAEAEPDNAAYVIYTSGSTGRPKGVIVTHRSVRNLFNAVNDKLRISHEDVWTMFHSYTFDFSVWEMWGALMYGGRLEVTPYWVARTAEEFYELARRQGVTILSQTPSAFRHFIKADEESGADGGLNLRCVVFGGEALEFESLKGWVERRGDESPQLINMYGITETTVHTTYKRVMREDLEEGRGSVIGVPLGNVRMYALDEWMRPAPVGVRGELYVAGEGLARGYLGRPELTAERFIPDQFSREGGERVYRTGDVARYLRDGNVEFIGRADEQVKIRGYRIELGEIEAILNAHPSVKQSVVMAREDGRGGKRLLGYVVGAGGITPSELKGHLKKRLPEYMVPEAIMSLEKMPLTANGKIDRKRLAMLEDEWREKGRKYTAPQTPVEELTAGIFEEVLNLDRVGAHDNFFEIGGHSLLATQVVYQVRKTFEVEIGVRSVFEAATVESLARAIEEAVTAGEVEKAPPLVRASRNGRLPLSFAQQRFWFLDQLVPNNPVYNVLNAVSLEGKLDIEALERSVNEIVRRHEALRTRFEVVTDMPAQVIDEWRPRKLEWADLTNLPRNEREEEARKIMMEHARAGFDLSRGPLLRVRVLKLEEKEHVALFTMHHIVGDGRSLGILIRELAVLYQAYIKGELSPLEELPFQYADFAVWQRAWLQGDVLERQIRFWREQLDGLEPLDLPTDHIRPTVASYRGSRVPIPISGEVTSKLVELSRQEGVTMFMTLLAAINILMNQYTGQEDIAIGANIDNRNSYEIEGIIGCFVNSLVLRTDLSGLPTFRELLSRVRGVTLEAYAHQDLPFEKLVEELHPQRDMGQTPLFRVAFVSQNMSDESLESAGLSFSSMAADNRTSKGASAESVGFSFSAVAADSGTSKFDLTFFMIETGLGFAGAIEYSLDLFESATIHRMSDHFQTLLTGIAADPDKPISSYSLVPQSQTDDIVSDFITSFEDM